jgi:hypothetical protein
MADGEPSTTGLYSVQIRQRIARKSSSKSDIFVTYGGAGSYTHYPRRDFRYVGADQIVHSYSTPARTDLYPIVPALPAVGVGTRRILNAHVAIRFDAQFVVLLPYPAVFARGIIGVSVPLGRYSSHSDGRRDVIQ